MVILFFLALLLAWPTFGLSIVAYVAFVILRGYLIARERKCYADQKQAERDVLKGVKRLPTWAGNPHEMDVFQDLLLTMAARRGVSPSFVRALLSDRQSFDTLLYLAGALEHRGASFNRQNVAVTNKVAEMWERAPVDMKSRCLYRDQQDLQFASARSEAAKDTAARAKVDRARARGQRFGRSFRKIANVAYQIWRVLAVGAVIATMIYTAFLVVTADPMDGFVVLLLAVFVAIGGTGFLWIMKHGDLNNSRAYEAFVWKVVFGDLPVYVWFLLGVLYLGGAGTAVWNGPSDTSAFVQNFAIGTGAAALLLIVGFPGKLLAPARYQTPGHVLGTALAALIVFIVYAGGFSFDQVLSLAASHL